MKIYRHILFFVLIAGTFNVSCKKYLEVKQNQQLSTPETLTDLQALLDNREFYRYFVRAIQDQTDEFYVHPSRFFNYPTSYQEVHTWQPQADDEDDWVGQYNLVLICNTVLDRIDKIPGSNTEAANDIKGAALFKRAFCYYQLSQVYAPTYDEASATNDLGIVLRDDIDFTVPSQRSTIKQTYDRITTDLEAATNLLPATSEATTRPNKASAFGLLARVYLQMGLYEKARTAANNSLNLYDQLIDFNDPTEVNTTLNYPFINSGIRHKEILYYHADGGSFSAYPFALTDTAFYNAYDTNDLRKTVFFNFNASLNGYAFKGTYIGDRGNFMGIGTDEVYLIRAECNARLGNISATLADLTKLLSNRYIPGTVPIFAPSTPEDALIIVLNERKKELYRRGVRWSDIRRLNKHYQANITISRNINGLFFTLPPNDLRSTLLIPKRVMQLTNLQQNPR